MGRRDPPGIGALYDIERKITGRPAGERLAVRLKESRPRVEAFHAWCADQLARLPGNGDLAKAMRYAFNRWDAFTLFLEDGRVAIDNNVAERAIRPIAIGRNYVHAVIMRSSSRGTAFFPCPG